MHVSELSCYAPKNDRGQNSVQSFRSTNPPPLDVLSQNLAEANAALAESVHLCGLKGYGNICAFSEVFLDDSNWEHLEDEGSAGNNRGEMDCSGLNVCIAMEYCEGGDLRDILNACFEEIRKRRDQSQECAPAAIDNAALDNGRNAGLDELLQEGSEGGIREEQVWLWLAQICQGLKGTWSFTHILNAHFSAACNQNQNQKTAGQRK